MTYYPIVICGPSGTGKDTAIKALISKNPKIRDAVGYTTRTLRENEINGKDICSVTKEAFEQLINDELLIEHAEFDNEYYGMPKIELEKAETEMTVFNIGVSGAKAIKEFNSNAVTILLLPPSKEELVTRLGNRGEERLKRVKNDVAEAASFFDYCVISENNEIDKLVQDIESIIYNQNQDFHISNSTEFIEGFLSCF